MRGKIKNLNNSIVMKIRVSSIIILLMTCTMQTIAQSEYQDNIEAARNGDSNAQNAIGLCYAKGNGVPQDYEKAVAWYRRAAEQGNTTAQFNLGYSYDKGEGVIKNMSLAIYWYKKSAKSGLPQAQFNLSICYFLGEGVSQNSSKGFEWCRKAAEQGYVNAQFGLASCYEKGDGIKKDLSKAAYWYNLAAQQGDVQAMFSLGCLYYIGEGINKSFENAVYWFRKAAESGEAPAQACLAQSYELGEGVTKDMDMAFFWYQKAADQGYEDAINKLKSLKDNNKDYTKNQTNTINSGFVSDIDINIPITDTVENNYFAIIIGNEIYNNEAAVPYASNDAKIFCEYVEKTLGVPRDQIRLIENAGYNDIRIAINWLAQAMTICRGKGKAIIYYAGHGIPNESDLSSYLLPVDGIGNDPGSAFSLKDMYEKLGSVEAQSVTIFLDACFSGSKREEGMLASARGVAIKAIQSAPKGNMIVFSAAQGDETAYSYKDKRHGLFTYFLLKKLQETKGEVTLGELSEYLTEQVGRQSFVKNNKMQTPTVNVSSSMQNGWRLMKLK